MKIGVDNCNCQWYYLLIGCNIQLQTKYAGQEVKKVGSGMTKAELISFLEVLAQLIEAKTGNKEAAEIVRSAKPKE